MHEDPQNTVWRSEEHFHLLDPQVSRQTTVRLQGQVKLAELLSRDEGRVELYWQHAEVAVKRVLQDCALAHPREQRDAL